MPNFVQIWLSLSLTNSNYLISLNYNAHFRFLCISKCNLNSFFVSFGFLTVTFQSFLFLIKLRFSYTEGFRHLYQHACRMVFLYLFLPVSFFALILLPSVYLLPLSLLRRMLTHSYLRVYWRFWFLHLGLFLRRITHAVQGESFGTRWCLNSLWLYCFGRKLEIALQLVLRILCQSLRLWAEMTGVSVALVISSKLVKSVLIFKALALVGLFCC